MTALLFLVRNWQVALGTAVVLALIVAWQADRRAQFNAGIAQERAAAVERANDLIKKMEQDNAEISGLDDRAICAEFGFEWLPDRGCY